MSAPIYLDYAATTPVDPRVARAVADCLLAPDAQANPASATHGLGLAASDRVEQARAAVAALIGADPREIIFTSGATESNNLALLGVAGAARRAGRSGHFVSSRVEHKSVLDVLKQLEKEGFEVTLLEPDEAGRVPPEAVRTALRPNTLLVSLMLANNEIGVLNDIRTVARICEPRGILLHTDASQAVGKLPVGVNELGVDFLSLTAHKFYGPKGIGALYVRERARPRIAPIQFGGGHERGLRSGTLATHQVVGLGQAATIARDQLARDSAHACALIAQLRGGLASISGVEFNSQAEGVPGILNASFPGVEGESLVAGLVELAVSTGSACSSATREPSYVLRSLGRSQELAQSSLRFSLGRFSTAADVDIAAKAVRREVERLRAIAGNAETSIPPAPIGDGGEFSWLRRTLSPLAQKYFRTQPRPLRHRPGEALPSDVRHGRAGHPEQGTAVLFELQIDAGFVKSARFSAYGCPHTLAVVAWICEAIEGRPLAALNTGKPTDWAQRFDVPIEKLGRLLIVEDALCASLVG